MLNLRCSIEHSTLHIEHYGCLRFPRKSSGSALAAEVFMNQIRFSRNRFRFSQNILIDHPLCEKAVMRTCQTPLQSYRFEFCANP